VPGRQGCSGHPRPTILTIKRSDGFVLNELLRTQHGSRVAVHSPQEIMINTVPFWCFPEHGTGRSAQAADQAQSRDQTKAPSRPSAR